MNYLFMIAMVLATAGEAGSGIAGDSTAKQPPLGSASPIAPLPRITVRAVAEGYAYLAGRDSGKRFIPKGFNHTVLDLDGRGWHATFNTHIYDPEAMERTLTRMEKLGANVVRVWIWGTQNETGFTGARESEGLNAAYMRNVLDFLRRATVHGIYVVPILDEVPHNAEYRRLAASVDAPPWPDPVRGHNRQYLAKGPIAAKAACARDFVRYIKNTESALLNTVLAWSLANEVFVRHNAYPFRLDEGEVVTANGRGYDMALPEERQACWDEGVLHWANTLAEAIRSVDPDALVTAGMWTSDAHGRPPASGLMPDGKDPRRPPRPSVLGGPASKLDLIDVHIYPWGGTAEVRREAHERALVSANRIPALVGEYGVFKNKAAAEAREMMSEMLRQAYAMGYQGDIHWVWDLTGVRRQTWSAVEEGIGAFVMGIERKERVQ